MRLFVLFEAIKYCFVLLGWKTNCDPSEIRLGSVCLCTQQQWPTRNTQHKTRTESTQCSDVVKKLPLFCYYRTIFIWLWHNHPNRARRSLINAFIFDGSIYVARWLCCFCLATVLKGVCVCRFWDACWLIAPTGLSKSGWFVRPIRLGGPRPGRESWCRGVVLSLAKTKSTVIAAALERYLFVCLFVFLTFVAIKLGSLCVVCGAAFLKCSKRTDVRI